MDSNPCIAAVSCCSVKTPDSIIEHLTEHTDIKKVINDNISTYSWTINTKYYTAEVDLCPVKIDESRSDTFNGRVEAVIVYFDSNSESGLKDVKMWDNLLKDCEPDVKLLVTDACTSDTIISNSSAVKWCVKNGFELIELSPDTTKTEDADGSNDEDDDIITEMHGAERILEALQNHLWSNLIMKTKEEAQSQTKKDNAPSSSIDSMITNMFNDDDADFAELFQHLSMMREGVQSLSVRERRQCAEQVVSAFWRAIGGDEEEIADI